MRRTIIGLQFFLLLAALLWGEEGIRIEWAESPDHTYLIELRKEGRPLFEERLGDPLVILDLAPGKYDYRITFLNKFDKADTVTDWIDLTVLKDLVPVIIEVPEHTLYAGESSRQLTVYTADIMEGAVIRLEGKDTEENIPYETRGENTLTITLETEHLSAGLYDLRIINPSGSETVKKDCIRIKEKVSPSVREIEPPAALLDNQIPRVILRGSNLDRDLVAFLERDGKRHRLPLSEYVNSGEIALWFNLAGLETGTYDLVIINPPLEETVLTDAFTIVDPRKIRDAEFYDKIRWGTDLLIGFPLVDAIFDQSVTNYTFADESGLISPFPEMEGIIRADINNDFPLVKYLGWTGRLALFPPNGEGFYFTTISMGLYGRTRFPFPVNLFAEALMGYRWMNMEVDGESIITDGTLLTWGGGLTINYDRMLLELSGRNDSWIIRDGHVEIRQISLRLGYRF